MQSTSIICEKKIWTIPTLIWALWYLFLKNQVIQDWPKSNYSTLSMHAGKNIATVGSGTFRPTSKIAPCFLKLLVPDWSAIPASWAPTSTGACAVCLTGLWLDVLVTVQNENPLTTSAVHGCWTLQRRSFVGFPDFHLESWGSNCVLRPLWGLLLRGPLGWFQKLRLPK